MTDIREVWMNTVVGTALNPDGHYGYQCVDVPDHFAEFIFGVPWAQSVGGVAGANGLLDAAPDSPVLLKCGAVELSQGKVGRMGQSLAVRVERAISPAMQQAVMKLGGRS